MSTRHEAEQLLRAATGGSTPDVNQTLIFTDKGWQFGLLTADAEEPTGEPVDLVGASLAIGPEADIPEIPDTEFFYASDTKVLYIASDSVWEAINKTIREVWYSVASFVGQDDANIDVDLTDGNWFVGLKGGGATGFASLDPALIKPGKITGLRLVAKSGNGATTTVNLYSIDPVSGNRSLLASLVHNVNDGAFSEVSSVEDIDIPDEGLYVKVDFSTLGAAATDTGFRALGIEYTELPG